MIVISLDEEVVGVHLYSFYDLRLLYAQRHTYFVKNFTPEYLRNSSHRGVQVAMSLEYLSVSPKVRAPVWECRSFL